MPTAPLTQTETRSPEVLRLGDRSFIQLEAPSFAALSLSEKLVAWHLVRAAVQLDPIYYDQMADYGLSAKRLLGALVEVPERLPQTFKRPILDYARLFFANGGNRNEATGRKFLPDLTAADLAYVANHARAMGAALGTGEELDRRLAELEAPLFDPAFAAMLTEKNPPEGMDRLEASATNLYSGVRLADLDGFAERYPLNSRLVKREGTLVEEVYRAGTADGKIPPGLYAEELAAANRELRAAAEHAPKAQAEALRALAHFFETGAPEDWLAYNTLWLESDGEVDFASGFIEVYRDARGAKGSAQMVVVVRDRHLDPLMRGIAANALYFEHRMPWDDRWKKLEVIAPVGKAAETIVATGDFHASAIGVNLPNEEELRATRGSKSMLFSSSMAAIGAVRGARVAEEFSPEPEQVEAFATWGKISHELHVALHEILGHGSGLCEVEGDPSVHLAEVYSTLEETRADLVAYWHCFDPKLAELGVENVEEVGRESYRQLARLGLSTLNRYPEGDTIEEDHDRNRQLIVSYLIEQGAFVRFERNGHWYIDIRDFEAARAAVGRLLSEVMRIKATGDVEAGRRLVERYAIRFDPGVRDDVIARYRRLEIPTYFAGVYAELTPVRDGSGEIVDVEIAYPRDPLAQQLGFARENGTLGF
ncbi:MAG TPA: peptidase [Thermoanaerobaculia bacterium]|nr:peptidase [Thermoanaerobaculia bacterium]